MGFVLRPFNYFDEDAALRTREITICDLVSEHGIRCMLNGFCYMTAMGGAERRINHNIPNAFI